MMPANHHANIYANACAAAATARREALTAYHAALPAGPLLDRQQYQRDTDAIFKVYHEAVWAAFDQSKINRRAALDAEADATFEDETKLAAFNQWKINRQTALDAGAARGDSVE